MSLFSSVPLGLEITSTGLRAVRIQRDGDGAQMKEKYEQVLMDGVIVEGKIASAPALVDALRKLSASLGTGTKQIVVCLPPEKVYVTWVRFSDAKENREAELTREIEKLLPEERGNLHMLTHVVEREGGQELVAVAAVEKAVFDQYLSLCKQADFDVIGVTTVPAVLGATLMNVQPVLLMHAFSSGATLTVFRGGWPVDELVLGPATQSLEIAASARSFLKEYAGYGLPIKYVAMQGDEQLLSQIRTALSVVPSVFADGVKEQPSKKEKLVASVPLVHALQTAPWLSQRDAVWAGAAAASFIGETLPLNFMSEPRHTGGMRKTIILLLGVGVGIAVAVAWFLLR